MGKAIVNGDFKKRVGVCPQNIVLWSKLDCLEQLIFIAQMYGTVLNAKRVRTLKVPFEFEPGRKNQQTCRYTVRWDAASFEYSYGAGT